MTYKTIVVHVDDTKTCTARLDAAIALARTFKAHLRGLVSVPAFEVPGYLRAELGEELIRINEERRNERIDVVRHRFLAATKNADVAAETLVSAGDPTDALEVCARYADLVVMGQAEPGSDNEANARRALELTILNAGRPVLVIPYTGSYPRIGRRVLVAWNASREATRAVTDAMPFLEHAGLVTVLTANARTTDMGHGDLPGADIALHLARHGVRAEAAPTHSGDVDVGEWLLSRAADLEVDLMVMGAYGHSRLRELVMGGATRSILQHMTVPVLFSH